MIPQNLYVLGTLKHKCNKRSDKNKKNVKNVKNVETIKKRLWTFDKKTLPKFAINDVSALQQVSKVFCSMGYRT